VNLVEVLISLSLCPRLFRSLRSLL